MADPDNKPPGNVVVVPVGPAMLLPGDKVIPATGHIFLDGSGVGLTDIAKALQSHEEAVAEAIAAKVAEGQTRSTVHPQITDSVTQANVKVLGDAPTIPMGNLYQATAQALANAANNATAEQQQPDTPAQAVSPKGDGSA